MEAKKRRILARYGQRTVTKNLDQADETRADGFGRVGADRCGLWTCRKCESGRAATNNADRRRSLGSSNGTARRGPFAVNQTRQFTCSELRSIRKSRARLARGRLPDPDLRRNQTLRTHGRSFQWVKRRDVRRLARRRFRRSAR